MSEEIKDPTFIHPGSLQLEGSKNLNLIGLSLSQSIWTLKIWCKSVHNLPSYLVDRHTRGNEKKRSRFSKVSRCHRYRCLIDVM